MSATHADLWTQERYLTLCFRVRDSSTPNLGDFATVLNLQNGKVTGGIVADESAPELPMGEGSIALAVALSIDSNPRTGGIEEGIGYVIYPKWGKGKPRASDEIVSTSQAYFQRWGGLQVLRGCLNE
jgi:hypothetical protein